ncbi:MULTISPECIES: TetR/AcrR family transcriptional regulator [Cupriavidus]|uniref:TetR/AcrR family transcriptional regulator n=1 Tax=Cupriavidus campinensis TaxID=151783 RepID=A0AAE9I9H7_9BURK|nr:MULTISPECIES: TetR/AcrR family transcriptional regulator [Cupriavidus]URF06546.1 TetR/AcrR family transcriptional regulator [Cupriavidus campinensis]
MARASRAVASQHKAAIEAASAKLIRERGPHAVSVAEIMANAGLTHGGFYGHFASKDDLVAVACRRAFEEGDQRWDRRIAGAGGDRRTARRALVAAYLTPAHRDHAAEGCAASALAADVAREDADKPVRPVYREGLSALIDKWLSTAPADLPEAEARQQALVEVSAMAGALMLARATAGDPLSEAILDATRAWLLGEDAAEAAPEPSPAG